MDRFYGINPIFTIVFLIFMLFLALQRISEMVRAQKRKTKGEIKVKWTIVMLVVVYVVTCLLSMGEYFFNAKAINLAITAIGFLLFLIAFLIRQWSIKTLGEFHSVHIEIRKNHTLIKDGPYKHLRHPYYASVGVELLGIAFIPNSYKAAFFVLIAAVPIIFIRVFLEERELLKKFGSEFSQYRKEVPVIFPIRNLDLHHGGLL